MNSKNIKNYFYFIGLEFLEKIPEIIFLAYSVTNFMQQDGVL